VIGLLEWAETWTATADHLKVELLFVVGDDLVEAVELAAFALVSDGWAERVVDAVLEVGGLLVDEGHVAVGAGCLGSARVHFGCVADRRQRQLLATSLFGDVAAALREHGSATLDERCCAFAALTESPSVVTATCAVAASRTAR